MLSKTIDTPREAIALPSSSDGVCGLFAWGLPPMRRARRALVWAEFTTIFLALPVFGLFSGLSQAKPLAIWLIMSMCVALLSMTRSFHWADLLPVDLASEWRLGLGCAALFAAASFIVSALFFPDRLFMADGDVYLMLIAYPLLTALPIELVFRALFFRRFGPLFSSETGAIVTGALGSGLMFLMLTGSFAVCAFGVITGLVLGWAYLRSGQFVLSVLIHWAAALSVWLIGPGLVGF